MTKSMRTFVCLLILFTLYGESCRGSEFNYDPGFTHTASCKSAITEVDGEKGEMRHRGYPIDVLTEQGDYSDVIHLLLEGELPTQEEKDTLTETLQTTQKISEPLIALIKHMPKSAHPMKILQSLIPHLGDSRQTFPGDNSLIDLIGKMPLLAAMVYRHTEEKEIFLPKESFSISQNFLYMMFGEEDINPVLERAMEVILIVHADHEQNLSTSTVRNVASGGADIYACIAAGLGALSGAAHGGANEAVLSMLEEIESVKKIPTYINKAKNKEDGFRVMGLGHRVYKTKDPRASILKDQYLKVMQALNKEEDPLYQIAVQLEAMAATDDYFKTRRLYPNVDFYSGLLFKAMDIPKNMFTALFASGRVAGWCAQFSEHLKDPEQKIARPRQIYIGEKDRYKKEE